MKVRHYSIFLPIFGVAKCDFFCTMVDEILYIDLKIFIPLVYLSFSFFLLFVQKCLYVVLTLEW